MRRPWLALPIFCVALTPAVGAQETSARVLVYGTHQGGNVVYHYQVRNNGTSEIRRLFIGCDCRSPEDTGLPELQALPVDAAVARTDDFGTWYEAPVAGQPAGWRLRILRPRGASGHWIEWYMPAAADAGIAPGATSGVFSVTLPGSDETYLTARFSVHGQGARAPAFSAAVRLADTTPPRLSLKTRAVMDADAATAQIHVDAAATDDRDPEPRVVVESVSRPAGAPVQEVVYSATDASGNRTTATARVPLPSPPEPARPAPTLLPRASLP